MEFELRFSFSFLFFDASVLSSMSQKAKKAWAKLEDRRERDWAILK